MPSIDRSGTKSFVLSLCFPVLNPSKLKAADNFKFDENGRKLSKQVENTVRKGEIAHDEQFLLFPQCFPKTCTADTQKQGLVWERVNRFPKDKC